MALSEISIKPYRVLQAIRLIDGMAATFIETGDEDMGPAFAIAIGCIAERTMADATEEEWAGHRAAMRTVLEATERIEMELIKAEATQSEARA